MADAIPRTRWWVEAVADRVAAVGLRRDNQPRAAARPPRARARAVDPQPRADAAHRARARAWTRGWPGIRRSGLLLSDYYDNAHFAVTLGLLGWMWWRRADIYRPLRTALVLANVIAFAVFWRYPVAPPRMLRGFTDVVASTGAIGSWHTGSLASHANELAAMPSLHIAWAVWCTVVIWQLSSRVLVRAAGVHLSVHHRLRGARHRQPLRARHGRRRGGDRPRAGDLTGDVPPRARLLGVARLSRSRLRGNTARPAYRMSQTCYEVQDRVD